MKKRILLMTTIFTVAASVVACGSATDSKNENVDSTETAVATQNVSSEETKTPEEICKENGHTWVEATCTEPKTCSVCGETEGEALGHEWLENTPNYQQAKTCTRCGETEGEPLAAKYADEEYADIDKIYDLDMICENDSSKISTAKVWFTDYKTFESDDTHEAKEGYEYRSVIMHFAAGDDNNCTYTVDFGRGTGDYYYDTEETEADDGTFTVNWYGEDYTGCTAEINEISFENGVKNAEYIDKFGWSGDGTTTWVGQYVTLVPKDYDGSFCFICDYNEYEQKGDGDALEHIIQFRLN